MTAAAAAAPAIDFIMLSLTLHDVFLACSQPLSIFDGVVCTVIFPSLALSKVSAVSGITLNFFRTTMPKASKCPGQTGKCGLSTVKWLKVVCTTARQTLALKMLFTFAAMVRIIHAAIVSLPAPANRALASSTTPMATA